MCTSRRTRFWPAGVWSIESGWIQCSCARRSARSKCSPIQASPPTCSSAYTSSGAQKLDRLMAVARASRTSHGRARQRGGVTAASRRRAPAMDVTSVFVIGVRHRWRPNLGADATGRVASWHRAVHEATPAGFPGADDVPKATGTPLFPERALELFKRAGVPVPIDHSSGAPALFKRRVPDADRAPRGQLPCFLDDTARRLRTGTATSTAMRVRATVVSRPNDGRAILDFGTKVLTSDQYGAPCRATGASSEYPDAAIAGLSEDIGVVDLFPVPQAASRCPATWSTWCPITAAWCPT